ncbi:MAG TPA: hypothetical protein VG735_14735 [Caulobacterales bacterium]|nr:hypothetical protein [Caulobacterales bacterium]
MEVELEPFEEDEFVNEMARLALTDDETALARIEEADEAGGHNGAMRHAYIRQAAGLAQAQFQMFMNSGGGEELARLLAESEKPKRNRRGGIIPQRARRNRRS